MTDRDWNCPGKNVIINAICPDYCQTDMNGKLADARPAAIRADSILHGIYDENIENGRFWRDGRHFPYELEPKRTTPGPAVLEIFQKFEREQQKQK